VLAEPTAPTGESWGRTRCQAGKLWLVRGGKALWRIALTGEAFAARVCSGAWDPGFAGRR
jgi:hypothetical protein